MGYTQVELDQIFDRSGGDCHLCGKQLSFGNYARQGRRGAWEVDHSVARARGGGDHGRNLRPACISCNRSKRDGCSRTARRGNGLARSPFSTLKRQQAREDNTVLGILYGALAGAALGPGGVLIGAIAGAMIGNDTRPC